MNGLKRIAAATALLGAASSANAAWEVRGPQSAPDGTALVNATDGGARLEVSCFFSEESYLTIRTGENYDTTASYAASVPLTIVAGRTSVDVSAEFLNKGGMLAVEASEVDDSAVVDAISAIRRASGPIEIAFFQTRLTFPFENAASTVGIVIDGCW